MSEAETRLVWDKTANRYVLPDSLDPGPQSSRFLRGPVPLVWLEQAARLPGKAMHVAIALWYVRGVARKDSFKVKPDVLARFGIARWAQYRALGQLQSAGLIRVRRQQGQAPTVTLLKVERNATRQGAD